MEQIWYENGTNIERIWYNKCTDMEHIWYEHGTEIASMVRTWNKYGTKTVRTLYEHQSYIDKEGSHENSPKGSCVRTACAQAVTEFIGVDSCLDF